MMVIDDSTCCCNEGGYEGCHLQETLDVSSPEQKESGLEIDDEKDHGVEGEAGVAARKRPPRLVDVRGRARAKVVARENGNVH